VVYPTYYPHRVGSPMLAMPSSWHTSCSNRTNFDSQVLLQRNRSQLYDGSSNCSVNEDQQHWFVLFCLNFFFFDNWRVQWMLLALMQSTNKNYFKVKSYNFQLKKNYLTIFRFVSVKFKIRTRIIISVKIH
jgi:hypothetical protein